MLLLPVATEQLVALAIVTAAAAAVLPLLVTAEVSKVWDLALKLFRMLQDLPHGVSQVRKIELEQYDCGEKIALARDQIVMCIAALTIRLSFSCSAHGTTCGTVWDLLSLAEPNQRKLSLQQPARNDTRVSSFWMCLLGSSHGN
jgi:hypothetical protein